MKTFKLISLQIVKEDELVDILLDDGLIINKEDENNTWLIEAFASDSYYDFFHEANVKDVEMIVQVVITKQDNDPAPFQVKTTSVKKLADHISILLEGTLKKTRSNYAEFILEDLIQKGLSGEELLLEFKTKMLSKPRLAAAKE